MTSPMTDTMTDPAFSADEMMTVAAARLIDNGTVCFVGIGLPSAAANPRPRNPTRRTPC